ncbi:unnamed protein product [Brugia timori]|uniref:Secreted protein n=1 Tax=Brugia timori TaxID=42155 RepID=A0A0R3QDR6_9BILA|nr:unnamed protein product [Brugia timori]
MISIVIITSSFLFPVSLSPSLSLSPSVRHYFTSHLKRVHHEMSPNGRQLVKCPRTGGSNLSLSHLAECTQKDNP